MRQKETSEVVYDIKDSSETRARNIKERFIFFPSVYRDSMPMNRKNKKVKKKVRLWQLEESNGE